MKRLIVFGAILATLATVRPLSAQFITPRQGGDVIGNNSQEVISVQSPVESPVMTPNEIPIEEPVAAKPTTTTSQYVIVAGQVAIPGAYEFRDGIPSLAELIDQAGGLTQYSSREFYVYRNGKGFLELDFRTQANFLFQNGDILIAETPVRYYRELNNPDSNVDLYKLHQKTQVILLNLADRPVLLTVPPSSARISALIKLLNQSPNAMVLKDNIPPPHAAEIPKHAQLSPSLIPSCSIISFDPKRINRSALPTLPRPVIAELSRNIQVASRATTPILKTETRSVKPSGLFDWKQISSDAPLTEFKPAQSVANGSLFATEDTPSSDSPMLLNEPENEDVETPKLATKNPAKSIRTKSTASEQMLLSPQQKAIVIGFLVVSGLFAIAYLVRKKQEQRELLPLAANTAKHTNSIVSLYSKLIQPFTGKTDDHSELTQIEASSEAISSVAEAASSVAELASKSPEQPSVIERDSTESANRINPEVENRLVEFVNRITSSSTQSDRSLVELLVELAASQEERNRESLETPPQHAQEPSPSPNAPAPIKSSSITQAMFPMIWEQKIDQSGSPANSEPAEVEASEPVSEDQPESTPHSNHPVTNGPHRIALDRIFFSAQRERKDKESSEQ